MTLSATIPTPPITLGTTPLPFGQTTTSVAGMSSISTSAATVGGEEDANTLHLTPPANSTALSIIGASITGSSTTIPGISITGTLNTSGVVDGAAIFANITNTASGAGTLLTDLRVGGTSVFSVSASAGQLNLNNGGLTVSNNWSGLGASSWALSSVGHLALNGDNVYLNPSTSAGHGVRIQDSLSSGQGVDLHNTATDVFSVGPRTTNAHSFRVYNTYSSTTSYEAAEFDWQGTSNVLSIGTIAGSGGGNARNMQFVIGGVNKLDYGVTTSGAWTTASPWTFSGSQINMTGLPSADPHVVGRLWSNSGVLTVSAG